jgi:hypothetical protein
MYRSLSGLLPRVCDPSVGSFVWIVQQQRNKSVRRVTVLKLKLSRYTPRRRLWGEEYSSYTFSTTALDGGEWSASRPGRASAPGKGPSVPIVQEAGWATEPVWTQRLEEKSFSLCRESKLDRPVVQPVARHCTDWDTWLIVTMLDTVNKR